MTKRLHYSEKRGLHRTSTGLLKHKFICTYFLCYLYRVQRKLSKVDVIPLSLSMILPPRLLVFSTCKQVLIPCSCFPKPIYTEKKKALCVTHLVPSSNNQFSWVVGIHCLAFSFENLEKHQDNISWNDSHLPSSRPRAGDLSSLRGSSPSR